MRKSFLLLACIGLFGIGNYTISAQTPAASPAPALSGIKPTLAVGEVAAVNQTDNKISLKTSDGEIEALLSPKTVFKRVPADNPNLSAAVASSLSEISVGDKIIVTGAVSADKKSVPARQVILMTKSDIAKRDAAGRDAWRTRGVSGRVVSVDFKTQQVTLATRGGAAGESTVILTPKENINYKRYAADSVKFSDARDSSLAEIKVGDEVRALGDKSEDGKTIKAEQVISGAFKTVVGNITAIDTAKNEITVKEFQTDKPITIVVNSNSMLKKFPAERAAMMAMRAQGGGGAQPPQAGQSGNAAARPPQTAGRQGGQARPNGMGQGGGMRGGRGGDIDSMLERFPGISLADLKVGDAIGVSSTVGAVSDRYTAIKLLSGVEPFLTAPQTAGRGAGGRGGQSPSIEIPGLDGGFGAP